MTAAMEFDAELPLLEGARLLRRPLITALLLLSLLVLALLPLAVHADGLTAPQRSVALAKPGVVRIADIFVATFFWPRNGKSYRTMDGGMGSGFFINPDGYIVTNAHVTRPSHDGQEKSMEQLFAQFVAQLAQDYGADPRAVLQNAALMRQIANQAQLRSVEHIHLVITPDGSQLPFELKAFGAPIGEGKDVSVIKVETKNAPVLHLGDSDQVQLLDPVMVMGYPGAADTSLLDSKSALEVSITDGKLSAKKNTTDGAPVLQVSAPATHGNSGGPVLNDRGEVIGIMTFRGDTVNGQEVTGFSFVVPSSTIQEFVRQAGATNQDGLVDQRYRQGLELMWAGHFKAALPVFEEVKRLFPHHSEVDRLTRECQEAVAQGKDVPVPVPAPAKAGLAVLGVLFGLGLLAVGGGAVLFAVVTSTNRKRQGPGRTPVPPAPASGPAPVSAPAAAFTWAEASAPSPAAPAHPAAEAQPFLLWDARPVATLNNGPAPTGYYG